MRKAYNILTICSLLLTLNSCGNDWLNLEPSDRIETSRSISTLNDVQAAVVGIYNQLQNYEYYGARMTYYGDVTGDDMQSNGDTKRCASFYRYAYTAENAPRSLWEQPYKVIRLANNILAVIDNIKVTDAQK
ncbi:MAG TPA: RagB/SusD family nutrient uptake outer membrane protein, partial [Bacteroidales bacterium]|nr:RagB/SusD family nutrient uptake outer membrane protein [Bacteroidales bacterium]